MVSAACSISAFAMEVPTNTTIQDLNGVRQYIKIYTVAPDTDPQSLIDDVFEYDGYTYTYSSMTKEEQSYSEKEHHTETVTADTEKSDLSVVLKALSPSIEYDDGEFRGMLYLDHSTISTVASGYTTKSYTVSATKEIDNLDTNDMAYVPDTTTKNGVTVQLQSVDWQVQERRWSMIFSCLLSTKLWLPTQEEHLIARRPDMLQLRNISVISLQRVSRVLLIR